MGKTAESIAEQHGTVDVVVLHNAVSYRDPEDVTTDPREYTYRTAFRGERVTLDKVAAARLFAEGSIAEPESDEAGFAEAGMRDPSVLAAPPSAAAIAPESQQVGAMKVVVGDRVGDPAALMKLDERQLKQVAVAFGVPVKEGMTHAELANAIVGDLSEVGEGAGTMQQSDLPPELAQVSRRGGSTRSSSGGSKGGASKGGSTSGDGGTEATEAAQKLAAENDVDLAEVKGTGEGGKIGQPDVAKYLADRATSG